MCNVTTFQYDAAGNQTTMTDALGRVHTQVYASTSNRLEATVNPNAERTTYQYDLAGQQTGIQDARERPEQEDDLEL